MSYDGYYYLMKAEEPLLSFKAQFRYGAYDYTEIKQLSDRLPFVFRNTQRTSLVNLRIWLQSRVIQSNREFIEEIRRSAGNIHIFELLVECFGLSLNDTYWIKPADSSVTYAKINFYDNQFDEGLSCLTLTGKSTRNPISLLSPECTTGGVLAKCWGYVDDNIVLFKRNSHSPFKQHREVLSEVLASKIASYLGLNSLRYTQSIIYGHICSACNLFTSKQYSLLTISNYLSGLPNREINELADLIYMLSPVLNTEIVYHLTQQFVLDLLIESEDRHLHNWGFLVDNETNTIISTAPIYDNGRSLFWDKSISELENLEISRYISRKTMINGVSNEMLLRQWLDNFPNMRLYAKNLLYKATQLADSLEFKDEVENTAYSYYEALSQEQEIDFSEVSYFIDLLVYHICIQRN